MNSSSHDVCHLVQLLERPPDDADQLAATLFSLPAKATPTAPGGAEEAAGDSEGAGLGAGDETGAAPCGEGDDEDEEEDDEEEDDEDSWDDDDEEDEDEGDDDAF